jgi:hypothetical protein
MKSEVDETNVGAEDELLARILDAAARIKTRDGQLRRTARELQSALRLAVGLPNICSELSQSCHSV